MSDIKGIIRVSTPEEPEMHPCLRGIHHWAMLTMGGTACKVCGVRKR